MEHPNIQTFKHSELPPMTYSETARIEAIGDSVSNFISINKGHYRALTELRETLSDLLDSCDFNLQSIRIVPDGGEPELLPKAIGLTELSQREKQLIASNAMAVTTAVEIIAGLFGCGFFEAARQVRQVSQDKFQNTSDEGINKLVEDMARSVREHPEGGVFVATVLHPTPED